MMKHRAAYVVFFLSIYVLPCLSHNKSGGWKEVLSKQRDAVSAQRRRIQTRAPRNYSSYQAIVSKNEAVFTFPLSPEREYRWSSGGLTYEWSVTVNGKGGANEFGFYLFTAMGASTLENGDIHALLQAGQCSMFKVVPGGTYSDSDVEVAAAEIKCSANDDRTSLTVRLLGEDSIKHFFLRRPPFVSFRTRLGLGSKPAVARVPVRYSAAAATTRSSLGNSVPCLTSESVRNLLLPLTPLHEPIFYELNDGGGVVYNGLRLSDVQSSYPITFLFFRRGFIKLEDNGANTFESLTGRGQQLRATYPNGIPLANLSLVSVGKVICKGTDAKVQVTVAARPTQIAINLLGEAIFSTRPFAKSNERVVSFVYRSEKWEPGSSAADEIVPGTR